MSTTDSLGDRMKGYEAITKNFLMRRTPVIIRLDGKSFHTFTKKITPTNDPSLKDRPFSEKLHRIMNCTMLALCNNIQNVQFGYTQSDEITLVLKDWQTLTTDQWFGGNVQKIVSISAAMATAYFNYYYAIEFNNNQTYSSDLAFFDSRTFNLPIEEVTNNLIWRQQDATRNSVQMLGQFYFSHNELHKKNVSQIQDKLMEDYNINWNNLPTWMKRGSSVYKTEKQGFVIDDEIPIFTQDRNFIDRFIL